MIDIAAKLAEHNHEVRNQEVQMTADTAKQVPPLRVADEEAMSIAKPSGFSLDDFKSNHAAALANVETLLPGLPHHSIAQAKDFVRLHHNEENYWSDELCFVSVPIQGQKKDLLHLIVENLAKQYLPSARILRHRLALASKPYDRFFLCHVPSQNLENIWNETNLRACVEAKKFWVQATSRSQEAQEGYVTTFARDADAFPDPKWPSQSLAELIENAFSGRMITSADDPALLRLIGASQKL
jgi:hypothetical protein